MNQQTQAISRDLSQLAIDAHALLSATADVAGDKVADARKRLTAALERGTEMCEEVREKAMEGAKAADSVIHHHTYQAIAVGVGVGAFIGYLIARQPSPRTH
jgi:ElaB/YqjD/DUF883 family membrane-anchored ribosome-binding protein